jgi:MFS family permease
MNALSARLSLGFSQIGHTYAHLFMMLYPVVVLTLEKEWGLPYDELLPLALAGTVLFGAAALPAGWLGDRFGALGLMVIYFVGTGAASVLTGFARTPFEIGLGLAAIGLFAAIYHPVGIAWLVQVAVKRGQALGWSGVFGNIGFGSAGVVAGVLIDLAGWRAAFIVPGLVSILTGFALWGLARTGVVGAATVDRKPEPPASREDMIRAFVVLSVTMLCAGLISQSISVAMPKLFAERLPADYGGSASTVGALVSVVFVLAGAIQLAGGHLSDRVSMKWSYLVAYLLQVPAMLLVANMAGWPMMVTATAIVMLGTAVIPAESGLLARYTPVGWRGTAFGIKFVLSLGVSAAGLPLVSYIYGATGDFVWLFYVLAGVAALLVLSGVFLPGDRGAKSAAPVPVPAPAE